MVGCAAAAVVHVDAQAVTQTVAKIFTVSRLRDDVRRNTVQVRADYSACAAAIPASCARRTVSYTLRCSSDTWPTATVRVISEQ